MNEKFRDLNDVQFEAVTCTEGPMLILAGAGSGKTRVLTYRTAYLIEECGVSPYQIMALTFTNKAAGEMKERISSIVGPGAENIWVSTFHSSCVRILRRFIDLIGYNRDFTIYDSDDQKTLMRDVCRYLQVDTKKFKEGKILGVISSAKDELVDPELFEKRSAGDPAYKVFAACYKEYQKRLALNNALDFDDLIMKTVELFKTSEMAAEYYRERFAYIMVDEYQDTNTAQFELVRLLARHPLPDGGVAKNLCVVGDDDQSIYKFRGANIRNILDFEKTYPDAKVIRLEQNYRSTGNILEVANDVIRNNIARKEKKLWTQNVTGENVRLIKCDSDRDEAFTVAGEIKEGIDAGRAYSDYAILYRTNAQSRSFEERFISMNIPYRIIGGQNFYQRKEIKDVLAYLRTIASGRDSVALKRIINVPKRGIGLASIDKVEEYSTEKGITFYDALLRAGSIPGLERAAGKIESFVALIEVMRSRLDNSDSLKDLIDEIIEQTGYMEYLESEDDDEVKVQERSDNISELISKLASYEEEALDAGETPTLEAFLDEVSLVADIDSYSEDTDCVVLMTIHSAKGLEFPIVYMAGMEDGIFPGYMSINADDPESEIEEERRLCYVGITRARESLCLTAARQRMIRGQLSFNPISRFVKEIPRHLLKVKMTSDASAAASLRRPIEEERSYSRRIEGMPEPDRSGRFYPGSTGSSYTGGSSYSGSFGSKQSKTASPLGTGGVGAFEQMGIHKGAPKGTVDYKVGDTVKHVKFGEGKVLEMEKSGDDYKVTVDFPSGQRRVMASFARLEKV
ncbi:MAG: UvrD-helicase domain-containing protein [Lachnospiraceae bacterium]|nr:UvrD-helicase domain-containing protein [Lachnospiraceae bacterium]MBQ6089923.1 UvrD-helicase domain-containing protein [Lachnospiraceae bacterium]MBR5368376.1 UvrD-helicase domain-containing protein [Lachnospiraceae bacterium]